MGPFSKEDAEPVTMRTGKTLRCLVCGGAKFCKHDAVLTLPDMALIQLSGAETKAACHVCADCGYIHWFLVEG